jgi:hypothetical protein
MAKPFARRRRNSVIRPAAVNAPTTAMKKRTVPTRIARRGFRAAHAQSTSGIEGRTSSEGSTPSCRAQSSSEVATRMSNSVSTRSVEASVA